MLRTRPYLTMPLLLAGMLAIAAPATAGSYYDDWSYGYQPSEGQWQWEYEDEEEFADQWVREYQPLQDEFEWEYREDDYDFYGGADQDAEWNEYEWEPGEGLHREEWYDAADDWTDTGEYPGYRDDVYPREGPDDVYTWGDYYIDEERTIDGWEYEFEEDEGKWEWDRLGEGTEDIDPYDYYDPHDYEPIEDEREWEYQPQESFYTDDWDETDDAFSDWYEDDEWF